MDSLGLAVKMVLALDPELMAIVGLSLRVSLTATAIAALVGVPLGAILATRRFFGRQFLIIVTTTFMALPPVVVGLVVYLMLSRAGPLGSLGLLFTPGAMIVAQTILILPIVTALSREAILPLDREYRDLMWSVDAGPWLSLRTLMWDARFAVVTAILAGFGRAIAEVGAVLIVGGNIDGLTRVMTTTIALETSKGNLELALALGIVLIGLAFMINLLIHATGRVSRRYQVAP